MTSPIVVGKVPQPYKKKSLEVAQRHHVWASPELRLDSSNPRHHLHLLDEWYCCACAHGFCVWVAG